MQLNLNNKDDFAPNGLTYNSAGTTTDNYYKYLTNEAYGAFYVNTLASSDGTLDRYFVFDQGDEIEIEAELRCEANAYPYIKISTLDDNYANEIVEQKIRLGANTTSILPRAIWQRVKVYQKLNYNDRHIAKVSIGVDSSETSTFKIRDIKIKVKSNKRYNVKYYGFALACSTGIWNIDKKYLHYQNIFLNHVVTVGTSGITITYDTKMSLNVYTGGQDTRPVIASITGDDGYVNTKDYDYYVTNNTKYRLKIVIRDKSTGTVIDPTTLTSANIMLYIGLLYS